jgi:putative transposase
MRTQWSQELERELFNHHAEAQVVIENYRRQFNQLRPHSALSHQTPGAFLQNWRKCQNTLT